MFGIFKSYENTKVDFHKDFHLGMQRRVGTEWKGLQIFLMKIYKFHSNPA